MKHLNILLVALLFVVGMGVTNAQDQNNPWSIELGVNAVDFFPIDITDGELVNRYACTLIIKSPRLIEQLNV